MAEIHWIIIESSTGAILHSDFITDGAHPRFHGWDWDAAAHECHVTDRSPDPAVDEIDRATWTWRHNLGPMRAILRARVDAEAEAVRLRFVTPGAGQAMEYQEAIAQAQAYVLDPAGSYPMVQSDVDAGTIDPRTGLAVATLAEAADLIIWMFAQWQIAGAAIRTARLAAKTAIGAATTLPDLLAAAAIDWDGLLP